MRNAGVGLRGDQHGEDGLLAGCDIRGDVEGAADEGAARCADLRAVDPDGGGVVDAVEVEPDALAAVVLGHVEFGAVPV